MRDNSHPEANLANSASQDVASRYLDLAESEYQVFRRPRHFCVLSVPKVQQFATKEELADLRWMGVEVDSFNIKFYAVAHVMGVHFRAGEWGMHPRCGSIITCVMKGESFYARVESFLQVTGCDCPGFASVTWFGRPEYPSGTPLVVKVNDDGSAIDAMFGSVVKITEIDPSRVMVEDEHSGDYYVMRDSGYDTVKT